MYPEFRTSCRVILAPGPCGLPVTAHYCPDKLALPILVFLFQLYHHPTPPFRHSFVVAFSVIRNMSTDAQDKAARSNSFSAASEDSQTAAEYVARLSQLD